MSDLPKDHNDHYDEYNLYTTNNGTNSSVSEIIEIEEEEEEEHEEAGSSNGVVSLSSSDEVKELLEMRRSFSPMPSIKEDHDNRSVLSAAEDCVYVAVGKSGSSVEAFDWALKHAVNSSNTVVYLIHIYPEVKQIPTPLGKLQLSQVSPEQVESFMAQERGKRRELLQTFLLKCSAANVKVDTILIESDALPKAILDLIDILNIRKLVVGTKKSSLRKLRARKGTGVADHLVKSAPETCEVKIICEGLEVVIDQIPESPKPGGDTDSPKESSHNSKYEHEEQNDDDQDGARNGAVTCMCFKSKFG